MKLKVAVMTCVVLCAILFVLDGFIYLTVYRHIFGAEAGLLNSKAFSVAQSLTRGFGFDFGGLDPFHVVARLNSLAQPGQTLVLLDSAGHVIASAGQVPIQAALQVFHPGSQVQTQLIRASDGTFMTSSVPLITPFGSVAGFVLVVADVGNLSEYVHTLLTMLGLGSLGAAGLSALGGYLISTAAVRPINRMIALVDRIEANHLDERVEVPPGRDEISRLAITFNRMLDRIQRSFALQSRFVADASHEIRTPLTTIQGYASLLARWGKDDPKVLEQAIRVIQKESGRLRDLANDLLTLASLETEKVDLEKVCSVNQVIEEVADMYAPLHPGVAIGRTVEPGLWAAMAPDHLKRILTNLVDNALKHTPEGGRVSVQAAKAGRFVRVVVEDTGEGIPAADLPHIFERFYRVDKARSRRQGGTGLGLAIVKELVELYGGTIAADSEPGQGTAMTFTVPVAAPPQEGETPARGRA
ncbi:MAG: HAMP domain-containing histidine kinase [Alicyclobacillus sp.]|nr:HAMP domain-containing histidine kinase [Alicyclobacillus sp.]